MSDTPTPVGNAAEAPLPRYRILEEECRVLHPDAPDLPEYGHDATGLPKDAAERLQEAHRRMHRFGHAALCLSGGGIRSASFALGVIQGLGRRRLLDGFDYLSTVSGGGFAGGWLTAWLYHAGKDGDRKTVFDELQGIGLQRGATEPAPVSRIRAYSRYMSPQLGSLSADSWTLVSTIARNILLNWLVLLPMVAAVLLVPRAYLEAVQYFDQPLVATGSLSIAQAIVLVGSLALLVVSLAFVVTDLPSYGNRMKTQTQFLVWCLSPLWVGTMGLTILWSSSTVKPSFAVTLGASVVTNVATWVLFGIVAGTRRWRPRTWLGAALSAPIPAVGIWWLMNGPFRDGVELGEFYCVVALPLVLGFAALMFMLFVALASGDLTDADLEWHARYLAWILITIVVWLAMTSLVFYAPDVFRSIRTLLGTTLSISDLGATELLGGAGSCLAMIVAYLLREPATPAANARPSALRAMALALGGPVFLVILLGAMAWINVAAMDGLYARHVLDRVQFTPGGHGADDVTGAEVLGVALLLVVVGFVMARFVPVNKFSLHGMYRERVVRAFLGASRPAHDRQPNRFTGFDEHDNLAMHALAGRPLHVVNTTLNLVAEHGLALQFRKAVSFTVTPLHAGSASLDAYRPADRTPMKAALNARAASLLEPRWRSRGLPQAPTWGRGPPGRSRS